MAGKTEPLDDAVTNRSATTPLSSIVSRRSLMMGSTAAAAIFISGTKLMGPAGAAALNGSPTGSPLVLTGFEPIPTDAFDSISIAPGYTATSAFAWGEPIVPGGPAFKQDATNSATDQLQQLGMGHDGIRYFPIAGSSVHGYLAINHEYTISQQMFPDGTENWSVEKHAKEQAGHGVSIIEIKNEGGTWVTVDSDNARRITPSTPMRFTGPAIGHRLLQTDADPTGMTPVGTWNNCGNGYTPWGTYLSTEENFNGYFWEETLGEAQAITDEQFEINDRYGVEGKGFGYRWAEFDDRFRADLTPNEPNRHGWMVEIDPYNPNDMGVKHTAMGRFKHEGAAFTTGSDGQAVVYMGDDQRFDYLYKFVSAGDWRDVRSAGSSPFEAGTLYVARFDNESTGTWLPLVHGAGPLTPANGFADEGDVLIKTRLAADAVGATPMDRPEWTTVHPGTGEAFLCCTNNTRREEANVANPRVDNTYGHIIKWAESGGDAAADTFEWSFFALAGAGDGTDGSTIDAEDAFGSPDGLWIDPNCRMWIQTDGGQPDESNNQMLCADPATGEIRRFLTGPVDCEVTGVTMTPDNKTMFINIQHPGDSGPASNPTETSTWPDGARAGRPRAATVIITKDDGGVIGT